MIQLMVKNTFTILRSKIVLILTFVLPLRKLLDSYIYRTLCLHLFPHSKVSTTHAHLLLKFEINLNVDRKVHMFLLKDQLVDKTRYITVTDVRHINLNTASKLLLIVK